MNTPSIIKEALFKNIISKFSAPKVRQQPAYVRKSRPWDKEIGETEIGLPKSLLPDSIKQHKILDSAGDGHLYLVRNKKGQNFRVDNEQFWNTRDPKQISIRATKKNWIAPPEEELAEKRYRKLTTSRKNELSLMRRGAEKGIIKKVSAPKIIKEASLKSHLIFGGLSALAGGTGVAVLKNKQRKKLNVWDPDHPNYPAYLKSMRQADPGKYKLITTGYKK